MAAQTIPTIHPADMKSIELAYRMGWPLVFDAEGIPTCALCDREVGDCDHTEITCDLCNKIISEDEAEQWVAKGTEVKRRGRRPGTTKRANPSGNGRRRKRSAATTTTTKRGAKVAARRKRAAKG